MDQSQHILSTTILNIEKIDDLNLVISLRSCQRKRKKKKKTRITNKEKKNEKRMRRMHHHKHQNIHSRTTYARKPRSISPAGISVVGDGTTSKRKSKTPTG